MEVEDVHSKMEFDNIPHQWVLEPLGQHVEITSGESPSRFNFSDRGIPYFKVEQLNNSVKYQRETPYRIESGPQVRKGSILFPKRGAAINLNKVRILAQDSFMDTNLMALTFSEEFDSEYAYYALLYVKLWKIADTTSIPQINNKHIRPLRVPKPPLREQRAIAAALSDVDALIEQLDALVAKKRAIKTGAMQALLTGDERLPGFSGAWETERLGDVGSFSKGRGIRRKELVNDGLPCVRYGELYTHHRDVIRGFVSFIPERVAETAQPLKKGDVLFAGSGETKEEIGMCAAYVGEEEAYAGGDIVILSPQSENSEFLGYVLNTAAAVEQKSSMAQGDAVVHLYARHLSELTVPLPPVAEQRAIAEVLAGMDAEIEALQARRAKTEAVKQGMMQELLTGKTRLVGQEQVAVRGEQEESTQSSRNWQIEEAVILGVLTKLFASRAYPLARMRRMKLMYMFDRHKGRDTSGYLKKPAGPYKPSTRYGGPEKIVQENGYVEDAHSTEKAYDGFIVGGDMAEAEWYFKKWFGEASRGWLEQFKYEKTEELEVLTTVDKSMQELRRENRDVTVQAVKQVIADSEEWRPKLDREAFSDANIERAMRKSDTLFGS